ncbi:MAG: hypothetical protein COB62_03650 [Piscirickettsiaceae bacterium]|nr:MAG: hypothetical protein COB62_03650 [Piscirickettsiaceae bacterium]
MNILFLCKRRPQNRDLIERPYGRFYNLPKCLSAMGHQVTLFLGSYKDEPPEDIKMEGMSVFSRRMFPNIFGFYLEVKELSQILKPDVIVCFSDTWFGIIGASIAKTLGASLVIDAYDNYEAYLPAAKPLHWLWRWSLNRADALTAAGPQLLEKLTESNDKALKAVIPMTADDLFKPLKMVSCRERLNLPLNNKLVGYAGSANKSRGGDVFKEAIKILFAERNDVDLVVSGRLKISMELPLNRLHDLGYIQDDLMPIVLNSCDLLITVNKDSAFGQFSYPIKVYEALACKRQILATDTLPARWILKNNEHFLVPFNNARVMAFKIGELLDNPIDVEMLNYDWKDAAYKLERVLKRVKFEC